MNFSKLLKTLGMFSSASHANLDPLIYCGATVSCKAWAEPTTCTMFGGNPEYFHTPYSNGNIEGDYALSGVYTSTDSNNNHIASCAYQSIASPDNDMIYFMTNYTYYMTDDLGFGNWVGTVWDGTCSPPPEECPIIIQSTPLLKR